MLRALRDLLAAAMPTIQARGLTLMGITFSNLDEEDDQLVLGPNHRAALDAAMDLVRERYGSAAITRAVLLDRDQGLSMPVLPDLE